MLVPLLSLLPGCLAGAATGPVRPIPPPLRRVIRVEDPALGSVEREYLLYLPSSYSPGGRPRPLILDFHGWSGEAEQQIHRSKWDEVGEKYGLIVVAPQGIPDSASQTRTWNISKEWSEDWGWRCDPDRSNYGENECHTSCQDWCDPLYGCTAGTTCYNDLVFVETLIVSLQAELLVDSAHIHITGYSNGGTLVYRMYSESRARLAGLGAVSGAPFIGGGQPNPDRSLIDFHGRRDGTVPHDYENSAGEGPPGLVRTIKSRDGLYYYYKPEYLDLLADRAGCEDWEPWITWHEGEQGWGCQVRQNCANPSTQIVSCTGDYGHEYPFAASEHPVEAAKILWMFFQNNPAT